jgi:hypothetical protein
MKIVIRRDVSKSGRKGRPTVYPFDRIRVGDAFDVGNMTEEEIQIALKNIRSLANRYGKRNGMRFYVERRISNIRCERVA